MKLTLLILTRVKMKVVLMMNMTTVKTGPNLDYTKVIIRKLIDHINLIDLTNHINPKSHINLKRLQKSHVKRNHQKSNQKSHVMKSLLNIITIITITTFTTTMIIKGRLDTELELPIDELNIFRINLP